MSKAGRNSVAHAAYMEALREGHRPLRAVTFTDRKKKAAREACRKFRYTD